MREENIPAFERMEFALIDFPKPRIAECADERIFRQARV